MLDETRRRVEYYPIWMEHKILMLSDVVIGKYGVGFAFDYLHYTAPDGLQFMVLPGVVIHCEIVADSNIDG